MFRLWRVVNEAPDVGVLRLLVAAVRRGSISAAERSAVADGVGSAMLSGLLEVAVRLRG
jgi:hypothetical protein